MMSTESKQLESMPIIVYSVDLKREELKTRWPEDALDLLNKCNSAIHSSDILGAEFELHESQPETAFARVKAGLDTMGWSISRVEHSWNADAKDCNGHTVYKGAHTVYTIVPKEGE